jgi:hypothetical protein
MGHWIADVLEQHERDEGNGQHHDRGLKKATNQEGQHVCAVSSGHCGRAPGAAVSISSVRIAVAHH